MSMWVTAYGCDLDEAALFREKAPYFGITPVITEAALSESTVALATGSRCVSIGHKSRITRDHLSALSDAGVRYLSTRSIGFDHVDVDHAAGLGIRVETVAYSPDSVADHTLMVMLMAVRHAKAVLRRADAHDYRLPEVRGRELRDLSVGIVGTGRIGSAVVDRLRAFGCHVLAYDERQTTAAEYVALDELLTRSDIVSLHVPLDRSMHHLLDRRRLALLRPGALIVNTARGALVDTEALLDALEDGRLGGAALDVLENEEGVFYADHRTRPLDDPVIRRLQELPNVIVTPHSGYFTEHAVRDAVVNSLLNCVRFEKGIQHD